MVMAPPPSLGRWAGRTELNLQVKGMTGRRILAWEYATHPSGPADRAQSRCRCSGLLGLERGPGQISGGRQQELEQSTGVSWAGGGGGALWQGPQMPCSGVSGHPESPRLCRQMEPWRVPSQRLHLPNAHACTSARADISKQLPRGAPLWETNGCVKPREDVSLEIHGSASANQGSSAQPRV